jgi:hypothetical protein
VEEMEIKYHKSECYEKDTWTVTVITSQGNKYQAISPFEPTEEEFDELRKVLKVDRNYLKRNFNHIN